MLLSRCPSLFILPQVQFLFTVHPHLRYETNFVETRFIASTVNSHTVSSGRRDESCLYRICRMVELLTKSERLSFALQYAVNRVAKGHLLQAKRWPFATHWISMCYEDG